MEASLTVWEAKERAGLLALETEEWREKRLIAENPNTTADVLTRLCLDDIFPVWTNLSCEMKRQRLLLVEALASHPNTMPDRLWGLLEMRPRLADLDIIFSTHSVRGICRNPIAPFICLEIPDFWERMIIFNTYLKLLCEEDLPPLVLAQIARCIKRGA